MREFSVYFFVILVIAGAMFGLYMVGTLYENTFFCKNCDPNYGLDKFTPIPERINYFLLFLPLVLSKTLLPYLQITNDLDINSVISLFLAIFLILFAILIFFWVISFIPKLFKEKNNWQESKQIN